MSAFEEEQKVMDEDTSASEKMEPAEDEGELDLGSLERMDENSLIQKCQEILQQL